MPDRWYPGCQGRVLPEWHGACHQPEAREQGMSKSKEQPTRISVDSVQHAMLENAVRQMIGLCRTVENDFKRDIAWHSMYGDKELLPGLTFDLATAEANTSEHLRLLLVVRGR